MLDFWFEIPVVFRATLACLVLGLGAYMCFTGYQAHEFETTEQQRAERGPDLAASARARSNFELGFLITGFGIVLVAMSGRSKSERNGYRSC